MLQLDSSSLRSLNPSTQSSVTISTTAMVFYGLGLDVTPPLRSPLTVLAKALS